MSRYCLEQAAASPRGSTSGMLVFPSSVGQMLRAEEALVSEHEKHFDCGAL